jgi:NADH-quinone oxidoreductase subunit L
MADINLILLILVLPLIAFATIPLFKNKFKDWSGILFCTICLFTLILSVFSYKNNINFPQKSISFAWFNIGEKPISVSFLLDNYTYKMLILVNCISLLVGLFSIEYMRKDAAKNRYFGFIGLFLFSMIGIIISGNLFQMYFFWELVGFSSYLLIGFWFTKPEAIEASKKAFLMNRIGDICFLIGIFLCFQQYGNVEINSFLSTNKSENQTLIGLLLFSGCIAKSAQFPLHTWLPDAMEGPTPVSALIHAATMVAAGIYLIIRVFPVFTPHALMVISVIGCVSLLMGGAKAIFQSDIKKVLAYSTISQLGLMVLAVGASAPALAFNHLIFHAFFKAGLFLSAGSVIHAIHHAQPKLDAQNMNLMGGLRTKLPLTFSAYSICAAAMIGLPFFSGFISKDSIIEAWAHKPGFFNQIIFISLLISSLLSAIYMGRQALLVFMGENRSADLEQVVIKENAIWIKLPLLFLAICSTFLIAPIYAVSLPTINFIAILSTIIAISGLILVYIFRQKLIFSGEYSSKIDAFYDKIIAKSNLIFAGKISWFDQYILDGFINLVTYITVELAVIIKWCDENIVDGMVNLAAKLTNRIGKNFTKMQSGQFQWYISAMVILLILIFIAAGRLENN